MKFYSEEIVKKARDLRQQGLSNKEIERRLRISDSTISIWCRDIPSGNAYHLRMQHLRENAKKRSTEVATNFELNTKNAKLLTSLLYWCEGSKYPAGNFVAFSNSDIELVKAFITLFRLGFQPIEDRIRVHLQLHTTHDYKKTSTFWSEVLNVPLSQFYKPTITHPTKNMKRRNYRGTCTVRYYDVYLLQEITGVYEEFLKQINQR